MPDQLKLLDCYSFVCAKAFQNINKLTRKHLKNIGISPTQCLLLIPLWETDGQSSVELCATLKLDSATMTGLVDRCETLEFVVRKADLEDRRKSRIWLTQQGWDLEAPVSAAIRRLNRDVDDIVGPDAGDFIKALRLVSTT